MIYLILADIHANLEALLSVLQVARRHRFGEVLFLGDLVGYAASPNPVLRQIRGLEKVRGIRGNHDKVAAGLEPGDTFSSSAQEAVLWTRDQLTAENRRYLVDLPAGPLLVDGRFYLSHGSPANEDDYLVTPTDAQTVFELQPFRLCFFGHTHLPGAYSLEGDTLQAFIPRGDSSVLRMRPGVRYLVNPGSVGQPRDHNPKAAFVLFDSERQEIRFLRVSYPVRRTCERILQAGLPSELGERLLVGA